jgi:anti-sigma B factor antagonist
MSSYVLKGEVDLATAESLRVGLLAHASVTPDDVIVDCSGLTFIDSSGLGALMAVHRALEGRELMLVNVPPNSLRTFIMCGLDKVVTIKPSALSDADSAT